MKNIGLVFDLNEGWIGGSYYIRNLISALGMLPKDNQPQLTLLSDRAESVRFALEAGYTNVQWIRAEQFHADPKRFPLDALFPWAPPSEAHRTISWIPDFQELHLPYYCSPEEISSRQHHHRLRFATAGLVVSSEDVAEDVRNFYPGECPNVAVVRFATFDHFDAGRQSEVRTKYGLTRPYIMCANQVWVHKNHIVVLKALSLLRRRGVKAMVCFTGNESDYRARGYIDYLKKMAAEWGVEDMVRFLGFIPRDDQLNLMKSASYVLQPSLFEGWSTVIEDAKAMRQFVVASDLGVHQEQLKENFRLFPRHDPSALAAIMQEFALSAPHRGPAPDYNERRRAFGRDFMTAVERFLPEKPRPSHHDQALLKDMLELSQENMTSL